MLCLAAAGCSGGGSGGHKVPASFEPGPCPDAGLPKARCGFLVVPENRTKDNGRTIRLAVAIVPATSSTPAPDPVVYMTGGPGGSAISAAPGILQFGLNRDRDLVVLEQRGTGFSEPSLTCPDLDRYVTQAAGLPYDAHATGRRQVDATRACRRHLVDMGADLSAYNTTENAADFADLRTALRIKEWNVLGASYGTDLALTYMREHPQGIRSVILDSVDPPNLVSIGENWTNAAVGLGNLFDACADQPPCHDRYPEPSKTFEDLVTELAAHPVAGEVKPAFVPGEKPERGAQPVNVVLDGGAFVDYIVDATGGGLGPDVPRLLDQFSKGQHNDVLASRAATESVHPGGLSYGLEYGVVCSEWVPYETQEDVIEKGRRAFPTFPTSVFENAPLYSFRYDDCPVWDVPKAPEAQRAVTRSSIPTLLLAGTYDTLTSTKNAQDAAKTLSKSTYVPIPGAGHQVLNVSDCARQVAASFVATPTAADTSCVGALRPGPFS